MKGYAKHIYIFLLYWLGINLYASLWYLGSDGQALEWHIGQLTFQDIFLALNLTVFASYGLLNLSRAATKQWLLLKVSLLIDFLFNCLVGAISFTGAYFVILTFLTGFAWESVWQYLTSTNFLSLTIFHFALSLIVIALLNLYKRFHYVHRMLGYLGKTQFDARQVEIGFMFLDLNDSTGIAEKLRNGTYSSFLKLCFNTLDEVLEKQQGFEIYQYVGDEVIVFWDLSKTRLSMEAIRLFQEFKSRLADKESGFRERYGQVPRFKAAIHGGWVTQSELGKRVLHNAFHGDVLNTTSKILDLCHVHQTDLLLSAAVYKEVRKDSLKRGFKAVRDVLLDGKVNPVTLYKPCTGSMGSRLKGTPEIFFEQKMTNSQQILNY